MPRPDGSVDTAAHEAWLAAHGPLPDALKPGASPDPAFDLPANSAIVGVIDVGIPLGHRRTQMTPAKTRILAAWQQGAERSDLNPSQAVPAGAQMYLPFGRELLATDINALLSTHSASGTLDEEAFNRAYFTEDFRNLHGHRELGGRAAHGAHVLDLAAGFDTTEHARAEALRIIAVNLPARRLIGHSARFLEFFAVLGMIRIVQLADAVWHHNNAGAATGSKGYPVIVNLSFGMQASGRDGSDLIAQSLSRINAFRAANGYRPVQLSIPAGNENLEMGNARITVQPGAEINLDWRVLPEDQSANFIEVWSDRPVPEAAQMPFDLALVSPDGETPLGTGAADGQVASLQDANGAPVARVYCDVIGAGDGRMRYVIATRATQHFEDAPAAPAGLWRLGLTNRTDVPLALVTNIQTDQTEQPISAINQRSYFDHPDYRRFDDTGRAIDSYAYPVDTGSQDGSNLVRRHGTINAIGQSDQTAISAGHQTTDGRPGPTSSTGIDGQSRPSASMPMRRGAAHHGVVAAGARDGSAVALEGTSFATAQLSKQMALMAIGPAGPIAPGLISAVEALAASAEAAASHPGTIRAVKSGMGRMERPVEASDLGRFHGLDRR
ncbi:MAG: hypothetical protein GKR99_10570 [Rhodobacteraceae bacterium]|nr:hypothetical protein [Paracoccaceae bacterium]